MRPLLILILLTGCAPGCLMPDAAREAGTCSLGDYFSVGIPIG